MLHVVVEHARRAGDDVEERAHAVNVRQGGPEAATETSLAKSREFIAWLAGPAPAQNQDEDINNLDGRIRYRIRKEGVWLAPIYLWTVTKSRTFGASYDPRDDVFVLAHVDSCVLDPTETFCQAVPDLPANDVVFVWTISASTGLFKCGRVLLDVGPVLAVGDVSCDLRGPTEDTLCKFPIATTDTAGPRLSVIEGTISDTPVDSCFLQATVPNPPLTLSSLRAVGAPSSAMNAGPSNGAMFASYTPQFPEVPAASGYARIFTMDRNAQGGLDGGIDNDRSFQTWFWPLRVGSMNRVFNSEVKWRVITY